MPLVSRILAALVGGFALAALTARAAMALPLQPVESAFTGMMTSFLVYAGTAIWVFAVRSARRAWAGILLVAMVLVPVVNFLVQEAA